MSLGILVVVFVGASAGHPLLSPPDYLPDLFRAPRIPDGLPSGQELQGLETQEQENDRQDESTGGLPVGPAVILLLGAAVLAAIIRWFGKRAQPERTVRAGAADPHLILLEATSPQARERAAAAGSPRNVVVACWVALEDAADRAGLDRDDAETAAEFTSRVLLTWSAPPDTVGVMAELYREARFSQHPMTEAQQEGAIRALEQVHEAMRARGRVGA